MITPTPTSPKTVTRARRVALGMILVMALMSLLQLRQDYQASIHQGEILVLAMVNAIDQNLGGSVRAVDGLLEEMSVAVEAGRWGSQQVEDRLKGRLNAFPEVRFIGVVDASGRMLQNTIPRLMLPESGVDISDREYYLHQKDVPKPGSTWIGEPTLGRASGERTIHLSRPLYNSAGRFAGLVVAAINPDVWAHYLDTVLLEEAGGSAVIRLDGAILARAPAHVAKFGSNIAGSDLFTQAIPKAPSGVAHLVSKADGNDKLIGYHLLPNLPVVVTSGLSVATATRNWRLMAAVEVLLVSIFAGALYYWARLADLREGGLAEHQSQLEGMVEERTALLHKAQSEAEQRSRRLAAINGDLRRLAQISVHHLQEPVRPLVSYTQLVRRELQGANPEVDQWLGFIETGGIRLKSVLRDFQRYAMILAEEPAPRLMDVRRAAERALEMIAPAVKASGVEVILADLPKVMADQEMLIALFIQMFDNSIRYRHPDRKPIIRLWAEESEAFWTFSLADNGRGIAPEMAEKAFELFERLNERQDPSSTGLGLSICRAAINAHGGRLWVEAVEEGSLFRFTLPKVIAHP